MYVVCVCVCVCVHIYLSLNQEYFEKLLNICACVCVCNMRLCKITLIHLSFKLLVFFFP